MALSGDGLRNLPYSDVLNLGGGQSGLMSALGFILGMSAETVRDKRSDSSDGNQD